MKKPGKETMRSEDSLRRGETLRKETPTERNEQEDQKMHQGKKKNQTTRKIQQILEEFRGIKSVSCIKSGRKRTLNPKVNNDKGDTITTITGISNVFGEFYSMLFAENQHGEEVQDPSNLETRINTEQKSCNEDLRNEILEFTQDEIQAAIGSLKKKKSK